MTDQQKLEEEAAKVAYASYHQTPPVLEWGNEHIGKTWLRVATAMRDFWAAHCCCGDPSADAVVHRIKSPCYRVGPAEPEMGLGEVLRKAADYVDKTLGQHATTVGQLRKHADRLDADSQQRERDIERGRRFCNIRQISSARDDCELADLGKAVRLAVEAEK